MSGRRYPSRPNTRAIAYRRPGSGLAQDGQSMQRQALSFHDPLSRKSTSCESHEIPRSMPRAQAAVYSAQADTVIVTTTGARTPNIRGRARITGCDAGAD